MRETDRPSGALTVALAAVAALFLFALSGIVHACGPDPAPAFVTFPSGRLPSSTTSSTVTTSTTSSTTTTTTAPRPTTTTTSTPPRVTAAAVPADPTRWDRLADCESGEWDRHAQPVPGTARWDDHRGGYEGGVHFAPSTWDANRDPSMPDAAYLAPRDVQIIVAERVLARQGWGAWPVCSRKIGAR